MGSRTDRVDTTRNNCCEFDFFSRSTPLVSSKSMESLYSSSSTKSAIGRRKAQRPPGIMHGPNEIRQRVISARLLRAKNLQNQLEDALQHIKVCMWGQWMGKGNSLGFIFYRRSPLRIAFSARYTNAKTPNCPNTKVQTLNYRNCCNRMPKRCASGRRNTADCTRRTANWLTSSSKRTPFWFSCPKRTSICCN